MNIIKYISSKIGVQLFISFTIIASITVLGFFITIGSLSQIRDTQKNISDVTVPFLTNAQQLSAEVSSYILVLEQLTNFDAKFDSQSFRKQIRENEKLFYFYVKKLEQISNNDNLGILKLKSILDLISLNTKKLQQERLVSYENALIEEKRFKAITLKALRKSILILRRLSITSTRLSTQLNLRIASIRNDILQLRALIGQLANRNTRKTILEIRERYTLLLRNISTKILQLPEQYRVKIATQISILLDQIGTRKGLFHSQIKLSDIVNRINSIIIQHKKLQQTVNKNIIQLISEAKIQTDNELLQLSQSMNQNLATFYVLIVSALFISVFLITAYIYPKVIKRIAYLSEQTKAIAAGNYDIEIDTNGTDEIAHMSQALERFKEGLIAKQEAEKQLIDSEERFDVAVRGSSVGLWDWNVITNELYWSPRFMELLGINENEFVPHLSEFENRLHPLDHQNVMGALEDHLNEKKPYDIEYRILHNDGSYVWFHARGQALWDQNEQPTRMAGSVDDISDKKKSETKLIESEQRYDVAVRGSSVGLWDWNVITNELYWSPRFMELLGIDESEFVPHLSEFENRLHPDEHETVMRALEKHLKDKDTYDIEYKILHNDGRYRWFHARGQAIWNEAGEPTRMAGSIDDISDKKKAEEELVRSNMELERFAFIASHDLQEPLRMVSNFTALLKEEYSSKFDATADQYMQFVMDASQRMRDLVNDLLDYSRAGQDITRHEDVNLNDLMNVIKDSFKDTVLDTNAEITFDDLPVIQTNPVRISRVFQNLIGNALKYQKENMPLKVCIKSGIKDGYWVFSISDNGIGIKPEYLEQIFVLFKRLHNKEEYTGTGIGLSICKKIVESIGGKIWVTSEYGKGSTFYFSLPLTTEKRNVA